MAVIRSTERARRQGSASTLALLYAVAARDRIRPSEIATELGLHQSSVTRRVRVLEDAGHLNVTADPSDGRSCFITLTTKGRKEIQRLTQIGLSRFETFVEDWDAEEVHTLARLLNKLEQSKAMVSQRELRPRGRRWQKKSGAETPS